DRELEVAPPVLERDTDRAALRAETDRIVDQLVDQLRDELARADDPSIAHVDGELDTPIAEDVRVCGRARLDDGGELAAPLVRVPHRLLHSRRLAHRRENRIEAADAVAKPLEVGSRAGRVALLLEILERRRHDGE